MQLKMTVAVRIICSLHCTPKQEPTRAFTRCCLLSLTDTRHTQISLNAQILIPPSNYTQHSTSLTSSYSDFHEFLVDLTIIWAAHSTTKLRDRAVLFFLDHAFKNGSIPFISFTNQPPSFGIQSQATTPCHPLLISLAQCLQTPVSSQHPRPFHL